VDSRVDLGPFRLLQPVARGAAGEVWRAAHRTLRVPAAVKVLSSGLVRDERHARQFRDEIRALAGLDHPSIVTLLDAGTVDSESAAASEGRLVAGSPWLALEYASDGTVAQRAPTLWPDIRDLALAILDALAHAHARGLVHRDLKPANLLWCSERDPRPGLKLTDFGIAVRVGAIEPGELPAGTPQYMAPEQLGGDLQDVGPWTDLYSLGCIVWRLTTGALPFEGLKKMALIRAHLSKPLPAYAPVAPVPRGLEDWLRALLAKRPEERPQRAADAAAALVLLDPTGDAPQSRFWASVLEDDVELLPVDESLLEDPTARLQHGIGPPATIPDWRAPSAPQTPELLGAGLGLIGLRDPPVVGRTTEQDLLWDELRAVAEGGRPRLVVIRGPAGCGRTRLGRWLCGRADEVGAARVVWSDGAAGGLTATVGRLLRIAGKVGSERDRWLAELVGDPELATAAAGFVDGLLSEEARGAVGARLLSRGRADRPTIACLDDAHLSEEDLAVVGALLAIDRPCLVLLLVDDEDCPPAVEARLSSLRGLQLPLGPLAPPARRDLLASLLRLEDPLAAEVEERSQGNPAFLVELVADWVQRGWLAPGPRGLRLLPEVSSSAFPSTRMSVAEQRLDQVLAGTQPATGWDLTMAAALGPLVDEGLWHTACDDPDGTGVGWAPDGVARRALLIERLARSRMLVPQEQGFLLQASFREAVVARAREQGRWSRVCATAARVVAGADRRVDAAQVGHLLLEARLPGEALPALLQAVIEVLPVSARRALSIWVDAERAANLARLPAHDPALHRLALTRARIDLALGDPASARLHLPPPPVDPRARSEAALLELDILLAAGDHAAVAARAAALRATVTDPEALGRVLLAESEAVEHSEPLLSLQRLEDAREVWSRAGVTGERMATLTWRQACRSRNRGDLARARVLTEKVLDEVGPRGDPRLRVLAGSALGEILARLGDPVRGGLTARRAIASGDATGHPAVEARLAEATCRLLLGDVGPAVAGFDEAQRAARRTGRADLERHAHAGLATAHAASRAWGRVHDHLREVERGGPAAPEDPVLCGLLRDLARTCKAGGYPQLYARARALLAG
jgi:serine/threonine protein kinase